MTPEQKKVVDRCEAMLLKAFPAETLKVVFNLHESGSVKTSYVERFGKEN